MNRDYEPGGPGYTVWGRDADEIAKLILAGDHEGARTAMQAGQARYMAQVAAEREAQAQARRDSDDPLVRAGQAHRDGDPDWRTMMPWGWRVRRWWWIHWLLVAAYTLCAAIPLAAAAYIEWIL